MVLIRTHYASLAGDSAVAIDVMQNHNGTGTWTRVSVVPKDGFEIPGSWKSLGTAAMGNHAKPEEQWYIGDEKDLQDPQLRPLLTIEVSRNTEERGARIQELSDGQHKTHMWRDLNAVSETIVDATLDAALKRAIRFVRKREVD